MGLSQRDMADSAEGVEVQIMREGVGRRYRVVGRKGQRGKTGQDRGRD